MKGVKWVEPGFNPLLWCPCERGENIVMRKLSFEGQTGEVCQRQASQSIYDVKNMGLTHYLKLLGVFSRKSGKLLRKCPYRKHEHTNSLIQVWVLRVRQTIHSFLYFPSFTALILNDVHMWRAVHTLFFTLVSVFGIMASM